MCCAPLLQKALFEPISVQKRHTKAENDTVDILGLNWKQPKIEVESLFLSQGGICGRIIRYHETKFHSVFQEKRLKIMRFCNFIS
jgi:hypothetical protein